MISALAGIKLFYRVIPSFGGYASRALRKCRWQFSRLTRRSRRTPRDAAPPQGGAARPAPQHRSAPARRTVATGRAAEEPAASAPATEGGIAAGVAVLRAALRNVPASPGVYRMLDRKGDAVYVGKARNLKSRVQNYTHPAGLSNRLRRMVAETAAFEIVVDRRPRPRRCCSNAT